MPTVSSSPAASHPAIGLAAGATRTAPWWRWVGITLVVAVTLLALRWNTLRLPPNQEIALGLWMEAVYLKETNFDYQTLWNEEPSVWEGGAATYLTSVVPTALAVMMIALPEGDAIFVVTHIVTIICTAVILVGLFYALHRSLGVAVAAMACVALFTTPLFGAQTCLAAMEIPTTAFGLMAVVLATQSRFVLATVSALVAFSIKANGIVFQLAITIYLTLVLVSDGKRPDHRRVVAALALNALCVVLQATLVLTAGSVRNLGDASNVHPLATLISLPNWCPDFLFLLVLSAAATTVAFSIRVRQAATQRPELSAWQRLVGALRSELQERPLLVLTWIVLAGGMAATSTISFIPRYLVFLLPFLVMACSYVFSVGGRYPVAACLVLAVMSGFNLFNSRGAFYPDFTHLYGVELARTGGPLDRSYEVMDDHHANLEGMQALADYDDGQPIVAPRPYIDMLAMPETGFIDIDATIYGANSYSDQFPKVRDAVTLLDDLPVNPIFIVIGNSWRTLDAHFDIPRPEPGDHLIYRDQLTSPLEIYEKRWPRGPPSREQLQDWYLDRMWPNARRVDRAKFRVAFLRERGDHQRAATEGLRALRKDPRDFHLRQLIAGVLFELGRDEEAIEVCLGFLERDRARREEDYDPVVMGRYGRETALVLAPIRGLSAMYRFETHTRYLAALQLLHQGHLHDAADSLHAARSNNRGFDHVDATFCLGMIRLHQLHLDEAATLFESRAESDASSAKRLAQVRLAQGNVEDALKWAKVARQSAPDDSNRLSTLGVALARSGDLASATTAFEHALAIDPDNYEAIRNLAYLRDGEIPADN